MGKALTANPRGTYRNLVQFEEDGAFPADGETPQKLLKGDGTESPLSFTENKAFINSVEAETTAGAQAKADSAQAASARAIEIKTANFTAVRGGRYIVEGTVTVTDPPGANVVGDSYEVWIGSGQATIGGTAYLPSRFSIRRRCSVAGTPGTWATPSPLISGTLTVGSGTWTGATFTGPQTMSGQLQLTAQASVDANSAYTRGLVDLDIVDFGKISYRDDFLGMVNAATTGISALGWNRQTYNGAGNLRSVGLSGHGVVALICAAAFRAGQGLTFEGNGGTGAFGFLLSDLSNLTTTMVARFQISTLNTRFDFGFCSLASGVLSPASSQTRKFVLNYTKAAAAWTASTAVSLNEFRRPTTPNGRRYYASVAGTTSGSEPTWPTTNGGTVIDGGVTWTEYGRDGSSNFQLIQHTSAGETAGIVVDTGIPFAAATWYVVKVEFVSGSQWRWTINGTAVLITTSGSLGAAYQPAFQTENSDNVANQLSIDYFGLTSRITRS